MNWEPAMLKKIAVLIGFLTATTATAQQVDVGASFSSEGLDAFYLSIGNHYGAPVTSVTHVGTYVPVYEVPVVYHVAHYAHVEPSVVLGLRRAGRSWTDITLHFGLSPEIYYVPLEFDPGPPYGRAYGYYKKHPRARWSTIRLVDADVVNLVNLRFLSEHHHIEPARIVRMRGAGKDFLAIERDLGRGKGRGAGAGKTRPAAAGGPPGHGQGVKASSGKGKSPAVGARGNPGKGGDKGKGPGKSSGKKGGSRGKGPGLR